MNIVEELFNVYYTKYDLNYIHLKDMREYQLISFTYGVLLASMLYKIDPEQITTSSGSLKENIDEIIISRMKKDDEDVIHDKDDVGF